MRPSSRVEWVIKQVLGRPKPAAEGALPHEQVLSHRIHSQPLISVTFTTDSHEVVYKRSGIWLTGSKSGAKATPPAYSAVPTKEEDGDEPGASARRAV